MEKVTYIYALCNPDSLMPYYIGKSANLKYRYKQHIRDVYTTLPKTLWIKTLLKENKLPILKILESTTEYESKNRERYWIKHYRVINNKLTNVRNGGEGSSISEEARQKISNTLTGIKHSELRRQNISNGRKVYLSTLSKKKFNKLHSHLHNAWTQETKDKMASSLRRLSRANQTGYKGVRLLKRNTIKYQAYIHVNQKYIHLGTFNTDKEAAKVYDLTAVKYFGNSVYLNFPNENNNTYRS